MSSSADFDLAGNVELIERIAGDVAHAVPVAGAILGYSTKQLSKNHIIMVLQAGKIHMHNVGQALLDPENVEALNHIGEYVTCSTTYSGLVAELKKTQQEVDAVKIYQIIQKRRLYNRSVQKTKEALELKIDVWTKSDSARIKLQDARLGLQDTVPNNTSTSAAPVRLSSPSEVTLVSVAPRRGLTLPLHEDSDHDYDDARSVYSDTNSMYGNPWLNHVVPESSNQSADARPMAPPPSTGDKGKGRAVRIFEAEA